MNVMKAHLIFRIFLLAGLLFCTSFGRTTLGAPVSLTATYNNQDGKLTVSVTPPAQALPSLTYHAVLLTDLAVSLEQAFREGTTTPGLQFQF